MSEKLQLYSVVLLKESTVLEQINPDNVKIFEESIIIFKTKEDFFEEYSQEYLLKHFNKEIPPLEFMNAYDETVYNQIVSVIDYFEIIDSIQVKDYTEVYSRFFIEKIGVTVEDVIAKHYEGFIFKNK